MTDKPDTLDDLLATLTPEIHASLKEAVALGRWDNGERLTDEQRALCLQAVIAYDEKFMDTEARVGYVRPKQVPCGTDVIDRKNG